MKNFRYNLRYIGRSEDEYEELIRNEDRKEIDFIQKLTQEDLEKIREDYRVFQNEINELTKIDENKIKEDLGEFIKNNKDKYEEKINSNDILKELKKSNELKAIELSEKYGYNHKELLEDAKQ
ncbi:hypothetical protein SDC9_07446 [bioreactor metagenome]|uniref:Uncharacterized protein n=1 Tax=bioreactor metagenome TaxID=1076179 RepID=A0A644T5R8_9ZZZZ|nr:hypothetical protein [Methanobrevibacter sp.]MEA4956902.1 hypothetical protein [Methanobrevibacter sp.]